MLLKDIYTPDVVCCGGQTTALEAARLMRQRHVGDLVVVEDPIGARTPLGVVTDRDLVVEVLGNGQDPTQTTVADLIRTPVVIAGGSEDSYLVAERMRSHGVRRVPVVDRQGALVGIVTLDDLIKCMVKEGALLVEVMSKGQDREQRARR